MSTARRIVKNLLSLTVAEAANKGIAFITVAYLVRIILPEGSGKIAWANSIIIYFTFFASFSFDVYGSREIAKSQDEVERASVVNNIFSIKLFISILLYVILAIFVIFLPKSSEVKAILLISGVNIFSMALLLNWFFQGIEKMEIMALRQLLTGSINLAGVMLIVKTNNDVVMAVTVTTTTMLINSLWILTYYLKKYNRIKLSVNLQEWKKVIRSSMPISMSLLLSIIYNYMTVQFLGFSRTYHETGIYDAAFKILAVSTIPVAIIQNAFFPLLSRSETIESRIKVFRFYYLMNVIVGTIIAFGIFTYSEYAIRLSFGNKFHESVAVLRLLMISAMIMYFNSTFSQSLLAWKHEKRVFFAMLAGGITCLLLNIILVTKMGPEGAAITSISTEFIVMIGLSGGLVKIIKSINFVTPLLMIGFSAPVCYGGYKLMQLGVHPMICGGLSLGGYIALILIFRIVRIGELRTILRKQT